MRCGRGSSSSSVLVPPLSVPESDRAREWRAPGHFPRKAISAATSARGVASFGACLRRNLCQRLLGGRQHCPPRPIAPRSAVHSCRSRRGNCSRQIGIHPRGIRVLAVTRQARGMFLLFQSGFRGLDEAAGSRDQRHRRVPRIAPAVDAERSLPYPSAPESLNLGADYSDKRSDRAAGGGDALRGRHADRQFRRFEPARARHAARLRPDRGGGHAPHRNAAQSISRSARRSCRCTITTKARAR